MVAIFDVMGNYIGDDAEINEWDDNTKVIEGSMDITNPSPFSMDYYRKKVNDFQAMLDGLNIAVDAAWSMLEAGTDEQTTQDIYDWLGTVDNRKPELQAVAKTLNLSGDALNFVGVNFPHVKYPSGLAAWFVPAAGVAAVAIAVTLIAWGVSAIDALKEIKERALQYENLTPQARDEIIAQQVKIDQAKQKATGGGSAMGQITDTVKTVAFIGLAIAALSALK